MTHKFPPHNEEAEEAVIGSLLAVGNADVAVAAGLTAGDFYAHRYQSVAVAIFECANAGGCDVISVAEHLRRHDLLERVGGIEALHQLATGTTWSVGMLPRHVGIVVDNVRRRRVIEDIAAANTAAYNGEPVGAILAKIALAGDRLRDSIPHGFVSLDTLESKAIRWAWQARIPIGEVTLLAGYEKAGKSLLCIELAAQASRGRFPATGSASPSTRCT